MMEFILNNYEVIFVIIVIAAAIISHIFKLYKNKVIAFILAAEEKFGPKEGYDKLQEAANNVRKVFPDFLQRILDEEIYEKIVQNVFDEIKDIIEQEKNKYN